MSGDYSWNFSFLAAYAPLILRGMGGMAFLAAIIVVGALAIGLVAGTARMSTNRIFRLLGRAYVEFFRNIPSPVHLLWWYYALPILTGIQLKPVVAATLAFSLYAGTYMAEIYRAGLQSIEKGQWEAGRSLGLGYYVLMRRVILPQVLRRMLPALTNQVIDIVKLTSVASLIAFPEILYYARQISEIEFRPIEGYTVAAVLFSVILIPLSYLSLALERRISRQTQK